MTDIGQLLITRADLPSKASSALLGALLDVVRALNDAPDTEAVCGHAAAAVQRLLHAKRCAVVTRRGATGWQRHQGINVNDLPQHFIDPQADPLAYSPGAVLQIPDLRAYAAQREHARAFSERGIAAVTGAAFGPARRLAGYVVIYDELARAYSDDELTLLALIALQTGLALDRSETAREVSEAAAGRLRFLAEASRVLTASLDLRQTVEQLLALLVPDRGDCCAIDLFEAGDELAINAVAFIAPEDGRVISTIDTQRSASGEPRVRLSPGAEGRIFDCIPGGFFEAISAHARRLIALGRAEFRSAMAVPLAANDRQFGSIVVMSSQAAAYDAGDLELLEELGHRGALAIDNARLYERERRVADTLQRALLPAFLPALPELAFHAAYRPSTSDTQVGGDWYDAFELPDGRIALSVGDVAGHGLAAAVTMGKVREAFRSAALDAAAPDAVLERAEATLALGAVPVMVTALFGVVDVATLRFTYAGAGHPAPLLGMPDGSVRALAGGGLPLGIGARAVREVHEVDLAPGALLVLYTDGLIEFDRDLFRGEALLAQAIRAQLAEPLADPAQRIVEDVLAGVQRDDVAVLCVTCTEARLAAVDLMLPASRPSAVIVRRTLRRFARTAELDEALTYRLLVAAGEAANNAIEHAYHARPAGQFTLRAGVRAGTIVLEVSDGGRWRSERSEGRGRGLTLMRSVSEAFEVDANAAGTSIRMSFAARGSEIER